MNDQEITSEVEKLYVMSLGLAQKARGAGLPDEVLFYSKFARVLGRAASDLRKVSSERDKQV